MLEKFYKKIARPLSIIFALLSVTVIVDYFIPREIYKSVIDDMTMESVYRNRYSTKPSYSIELENQTIRTNDETYSNLTIGDTIQVQQTRILKKITHLIDYPMADKKIAIYVAPFTYFPLHPILFLLPLIFAFTKNDSISLMVARPLSLGTALLSLLMMLF